MARRFVILNRLTGHVVTHGAVPILRRQLPLWREFYQERGWAQDLGLELEPVTDAARRAGAI